MNHLDNILTQEPEDKIAADFHLACVRHNGLVNATTAARIVGVSRQRMEKLHGSEHFQAYKFWGARWFPMDEVMEYKRREDRKPGRPI